MSNLNTITTIRLPDGAQVAFVDWSDKPVFSSVDLAHGFTRQQIDMFGYTQGDPVPAAPPGGMAAVQRTSTARETNLQAAGAMAASEERLIYSIKPEFFAQTADAPQANRFDFNTAAITSGTGEPIPNPVMLGILNYYLLLTLAISKKIYVNAGLGYFNTGFGPFAAHGTMNSAAAGRSYGNAGIPSQEAVRSYVVPQYMGGTEKFRLYLQNPGGQAVNFGNSENGIVATNEEAVITVRVNIDGLYKRPVS